MDQLIEDLVAALGAPAILTGAAAAEKAVSPWTRLGLPAAVVMPASTEEVSTVLRLAHARHAPVTPWGGKTGLVDGAYAEGILALSLERMNRIEAIDAQARTMTVQAGCILQTACEAAEAGDLFLPLDLGSRGSATIGGTISTNAGGNRVVRYGMMGEMVLGLEAVLADGTVISSLNSLVKNNAGYDLKRLFIGSEGTLGVVTRAVLRLRARPVSQNVAFVGVAAFDQLPALLNRLETTLGGSLSAFEVMWREFHDLVTNPPALGRPVLTGAHSYYVLIEALGGDEAADANRFEAAMTEALERGLMDDAVIAKSQAERDRMWALRDDAGQTARDPPVAAFDVSLKIADMEAFVADVRAELADGWADVAATVFGHLGDGNLHLMVKLGDRSRRHAVEEIVYGRLRAVGGSVSAEHGIGLSKRTYLTWSRTPEEMALMRTLKIALDSRHILNPEKILEFDPVNGRTRQACLDDS